MQFKVLRCIISAIKLLYNMFGADKMPKKIIITHILYNSIYKLKLTGLY